MGISLGDIGKGLLGAATGGMSELVPGVSNVDGGIGGMASGVGGMLGFGQQNPYWTPSKYNNAAGKTLNSADGGYGAATRSVQDNPMLAGLFGPGGSLQGAEAQEKQLMNTGFQLQPQDNQAYGQASNNLAHMFGGQESSLANSLSQRGFGSGPSGVAGAAFSGLQGNKNEMLAQAQTGIANARMNFAQQALNNTRQYMTQMGGQANQAIQGQQGAMRGAADTYNQGYNAQNDAGLKSAQNQQGQLTPTLGQTIGKGITGAIGGAGSGLGSGLGSGIAAAMV